MHRLSFTISALLISGCLARSSWPPARMSSQLERLEAPVEIRFDTLGVPHVRALGHEDLALAVGFLHARDRGWQLELMRHASQGRLAEILGAELLDVDRQLRLLSLHLDDAVANLPPGDLARVEAYCEGVNRGRQQLPRPLEMKLLGLEPLPWTPRDVIAVARLQAWDLSWDARLEPVRDLVATQVGSMELFNMLTAPSPDLGAGIVHPDPSRWDLPANVPSPSIGLPLRELGQASVSQGANPPVPTPDPQGLRAALADWALALNRPHESGSNAWAVSGDRTASGQPILSGDPHLKLRWPGTFYEVHLEAPGFEASGATFPGLPMVVIGQGAHAAWSITVSYADTQDLYRLEIDPEDPGSYLVDGAPEAFDSWPQRFEISDGSVHEETYRLTRWGPVYNAGREEGLPPGVTYALRWPGFDSAPLPLVTGFEQAASAESGEAFIRAVEQLPIPSQNWIFAVDNGDIGWVLGGNLINGRASGLPRDGSRSGTPDPGMNDRRPVLLNPDSGIVVATNQPLGPDVTATSVYFTGPYRSLRLHTALALRDDWTPEDMRGLQVDLCNLEAARFVPVLLEATDGLELEPAPAALRQALEGWDFTMRADSLAPLAWEAWRAALHQRLGELHIADGAIRDAWLQHRISEGAMERAVFGEDPDRWWDDPATEQVEDLQHAIHVALQRAPQPLVEQLGGVPTDWTWGALHQLHLAHPFGSKKILQPWFGHDPIPADGGRNTLWALEHFAVTGDYSSSWGPALRQVVVPGHEAGFVMPGGNAGQPRHPHAHDQTEDWLVNRQHRAARWPEGDEVSATLLLEPGD
jgi:penicillin amidase